MQRSQLTLILLSLFLFSFVRSQCDKCELLLSQIDCQSKVHKLKCKWTQDKCIMKLCQDFGKTDCISQNDGTKCYISEKRGCTKMGGCTSVEKCSDGLAYWCKPIYNDAWCVDEIYYNEYSCYQKLEEEICYGVDGDNDDMTCEWDEAEQSCEQLPRITPCGDIKNPDVCKMMFGCMYVNGECMKSNCNLLTQENCTQIQKSKNEFIPCTWNSTSCEEFDPEYLNEQYCLKLTNATYTWDSQKNECVRCKKYGSLITSAILIFMIFI